MTKRTSPATAAGTAQKPPRPGHSPESRPPLDAWAETLARAKACYAARGGRLLTLSGLNPPRPKPPLPARPR